MPATIGTILSPGTLSDILKEYYISPLQAQLNDEVMVLELFEKAKISWAGKQAVVPVHVGRNSGVDFQAEDAALTAAGNQVVKRLTFTSAYLYGRFEVTGPAIAAAAKGGTASFIGALELEMDKLKNDIRDRSNRTLTSGNRVAGFIHEKKAPGDAADWEFRGDFPKLQKALDEKTAAVAVRIVNNTNLVLNPGSTVAYEYVASAQNLNSINAAAGTINLDTLDTSAVLGGIGMAVVISDTDPSLDYLDAEPEGIYRNLGYVDHFGVDRGADEGDATELQSVVFSQSTDGTLGDTTEDDMSLERIQQCFDAVMVTSGKEPNCMLMHPAQRAKYIGLLNGNIWSYSDKAQTGDGGFLGLSYGGVPIKTSRHVDNGIVVFMETSCWKLAVLEDGKFANLDGNVLSRVAGKDNWEGFYKWYYNHYCHRPNANAVLTGLTLI